MHDASALIVTIGTLLAGALILSSILGWVGELRRVGSATSVRELHRRATERFATGSFASMNAQEPADRARRAYVDRERYAREIRRRTQQRRQGRGPQARPRPRPRGHAHTGTRTAPPPAPPAPPPAEATHRATLGLVGPLTADLVRAAYLRQIAAYHPDRVATLGIKLRTLAEEETKRINAAYTYFKKRL